MTSRRLGASIRSHTYRGKQGFLVTETGKLNGGFRQQVFTLTRASAERCRDRIRDHQEITLEDFAL